MVIKVPQRHSFSEAFRKKITLNRIGCSVPEWEISVTAKDDMAWSIVLSYLMSTSFKDSGDFQRRLKLLTGNEENIKSVKKSMEYFNPFRNRYACFYDKSLNSVINSFKKHFNWENLVTVSDKLSAVSKALDCSIVIIRDSEKVQNHEVFGRTCSRSNDLITLIASTFADSEDGNNKTIFNFLIASQTGLKMRKAALVYYLKETKLSKKEIRLLTTIDDNNDPFLIALLKSSHRYIVMKLYQSPYVISKLSDATFQMDPRTKDSEGLSALYYALVHNHTDTNVLYKLYYFAANNCCKNEGSYREPDCNIVSNLCFLKELLSSDMSNLEAIKHHPKYQGLKTNLAQLIKFNNFLEEVGRKILNKKSMLNYYETTKEHIFEASKRRDVIVVLLETYNMFFHWTEHGITIQTPLDDYITYRNYYNLIDMSTAIYFFDNILLLKENLSLENENQYSEVETSIFISILYHVVYEQADILKTIRRSLKELHYDLKSLYVFPLIKRIETLKKINDFSKILRDTDINENNVIKTLQESVICSTLYPHYDLKDGIELIRLKDYMKIGINVKFTDAKSVFVIEKVLQVIGESISPTEKQDFSFRRFLSLSLPKEVSHILRRLRHELSHLKGHAFPVKFECEENLSLFRSIQKEIGRIQEHFKLAYRIIFFNVTMYAFKQLEEELRSVKDSIPTYTDSHIQPLYLHETSMKFIQTFPFDIWLKLRPDFQNFLKMALQNLENEMKTEYTSPGSRSHEDIKKRILYILWPLKWLLELLQNYGMVNTTTFLDTYKSLENADNLSELEEITDILIKKCSKFVHEICEEKKRKKLRPLKSVKNIEYFVKKLKGFVYLSNEEKEEIRNEIPQSIKQSVLVKEELIQSTVKGFYLDIEENSSKFELTYLSRKKNNEFRKLYQCKNPSAINILNTLDPINELEKIFSDNSVNKKAYDALCEKMQFSDKTKNKLAKLVAGQRKKNPGNNLSNLLNRVKLLKKILIEENEEVCNLWNKIKSQNSRQLINNKILHSYLKDKQLQAAAEMLLFDCMNLFKHAKMTENPWIKSSKLYSGINLRNVISHGSPLLESICTLLDPQDLPSEYIKKIIFLIQGEDSIAAILQLYENVNEDYTKCLKVINSEGEDIYSELRNRIVTCAEWENYALLLPYIPQTVIDKT